MAVKITVEIEEPIRLDKFLSENTDYSRSKIASMIEEGLVEVDGKKEKASYKLKGNELILLPEVFEEKTDIIGEDIPLDILYEDDYLLVVNKPSGMVVHPGNGNDKHTLVNALVYHTNALSKENGNERPGIVHRIDKDTSGVLLIAKNDLVHNILAEGFKNKTIKRTYIALLKGEFPNESATIDAPIGRDKNNRLKNTVTKENSKEAITHLRVLKRYRGYTLAELKLETGRTHQIRVHMKYIGYPVYNDPVYTADKTSEFGQFLHAKSLQFEHPISKEMMYFESSLPSEFEDFISKLEEK
ncbi:MAG: RluA family pseudouridine synthase [Bacilli bacterium]|nr:RluA family pseudouridine synthase [Bacilli bacterium]